MKLVGTTAQTLFFVQLLTASCRALNSLRGGPNEDEIINDAPSNVKAVGETEQTFSISPLGGRLEGEVCSEEHKCAAGLNCEAPTVEEAFQMGRGLAHVCKRPGGFGDDCHARHSCAAGFFCSDIIIEASGQRQMCLPDCTEYDEATTAQIKDPGYKNYTSNHLLEPFNEKWLDGVVPYTVECGMNEYELSLLANAAKHIEQHTGIQFRRYDASKDQNWIIFTDVHDNVASSFVGRMQKPGWQRVNLDADDWIFSGFDDGSAIHELMHALGWPHTQSRLDRNDYVGIRFENIDQRVVNNFFKRRHRTYMEVGQCRPYNYGSIMHYGRRAGSINGNLTIVTKDPSQQSVIGQRKGLNAQDIEEIQEYYFRVPSCL